MKWPGVNGPLDALQSAHSQYFTTPSVVRGFCNEHEGLSKQMRDPVESQGQKLSTRTQCERN